MTCTGLERQKSYRQCEIDFQLELSRGVSFITSSGTFSSLRLLTEETIAGFLRSHGPRRLFIFCVVLADRLNIRGRPDAAQKSPVMLFKTTLRIGRGVRDP
jgi:hypothetical protein